MVELDECLDLARMIKEKDEVLIELKSRVMSPKGLIVSDMPKGGGSPMNTMDEYLIKKERIKKAKKRLEERLDAKWECVVNILKACGVDSETIHLMKFRFYCGLSWKKCTAAIKEEYPDGRWNANKCFSAYRGVLHKTSNESLLNLTIEKKSKIW